MADPNPLALDAQATVARLADGIVAAVRDLGRRGAVVAVSGGVDSSVVAALSVRALGPEHVVCLSLPERDGADDSSRLARELVDELARAGEDTSCAS